MVIRYRTSKHGQSIEPREIVKETPKTVTFKVALIGSRDGEVRLDREARVSDWHCWHDTWEEAHAFLVKRVTAEVDRYQRGIENAKAELGALLEMKNPEAPKVS